VLVVLHNRVNVLSLSENCVLIKHRISLCKLGNISDLGSLCIKIMITGNSVMYALTYDYNELSWVTRIVKGRLIKGNPVADEALKCARELRLVMKLGQRDTATLHDAYRIMLNTLRELKLNQFTLELNVNRGAITLRIPSDHKGKHIRHLRTVQERLTELKYPSTIMCNNVCTEERVIYNISRFL